MRVGGHRRVRTQVGDPDFGYPPKSLPLILQRRADGRMQKREPKLEWLMDLDVELVSVSERKPTNAELLQRWLGIESRVSNKGPT